MTIRDLKPAMVWEIFDDITRVPRPSKKEAKIRQYLLVLRPNIIYRSRPTQSATWLCRNRLLRARRMLLRDPAGHMDMVCESNDKDFDFENNPITTIIDGEWVRADGTTLGADNGIGMAASLAVMADNTLVHGPVEALFTMDEETGMTGANNLGEGMITGKILINLDSEDDARTLCGLRRRCRHGVRVRVQALIRSQGLLLFQGVGIQRSRRSFGRRHTSRPRQCQQAACPLHVDAVAET